MEIADRYSAPEEALRALQRQRKARLTLVVAGLIAAIVIMIGASALMYSDDEQYQPSPAGNR